MTVCQISHQELTVQRVSNSRSPTLLRVEVLRAFCEALRLAFQARSWQRNNCLSDAAVFFKHIGCDCAKALLPPVVSPVLEEILRFQTKNRQTNVVPTLYIIGSIDVMYVNMLHFYTKHVYIVYMKNSTIT